MKELVFFCILIILVTVCLYLSQTSVKEGFLSGTDVQLLTSKPYYTWYDYLTNLKRDPYYGYYTGYNYYDWYPYYKHVYY